jgi:hypothetical protein
LRQNDLATPGSEAASQSSQEEEDDVMDFIKLVLKEHLEILLFLL